MGVQSAKELIVYKKVYKLTMLLFEVIKSFPEEERCATDTSLYFSKDCRYINDVQHAEHTSLCKEIGNMLVSMINNPSQFIINNK